MARFLPVPDHTAWRWLHPFLLAALVVAASGRSQVAAPSIINIDKFAHFSVFGLLATLVLRAPGVRRWWWAVVAVSVFGVGDEIRQSFTPGRSVEFADWAADTTGALVACVLYRFWSWYRKLLETPLRLPWRKRLPAAGEVSMAPSS